MEEELLPIGLKVQLLGSSLGNSCPYSVESAPELWSAEASLCLCCLLRRNSHFRVLTFLGKSSLFWAGGQPHPSHAFQMALVYGFLVAEHTTLNGMGKEISLGRKSLLQEFWRYSGHLEVILEEVRHA